MAEKSDFIVRTASDNTQSPSQAMIGPSIVIKGDLIGQEDILVQGRVEGKIELHSHSLTVGTDGVVKANVAARTITVEGKMEGDVQGEELITIKKTGDFRGSALAPRVSLEDGAKFKGSIDMDVGGSAPAAAPKAVAEASGKEKGSKNS